MHLSGNFFGSLALYIHWPFCRKRCPYCSFNTFVTDSDYSEHLLATYIEDIKRFAGYFSDRQVTSIFFGGGTPSLLTERQLDGLLSSIDANFNLSDDCEITLEANPTSFERLKFLSYRQSGINRISLGVQSFDDQELVWLGREHSAKEALQALEQASRVFTKSSFDLIFALPHHDVNLWRARLRQVRDVIVDLSIFHISLYQLTIERGTPFAQLVSSGRLLELPAKVSLDCLEQTYDFFNADSSVNGVRPYEISNLSALGHESCHNLGIWRGSDYLGIGAGAHSRISFGGDFSLLSGLLPDGVATASIGTESGGKKNAQGGRDAKDKGGELYLAVETEKFYLSWLSSHSRYKSFANRYSFERLDSRARAEEAVIRFVRLRQALCLDDFAASYAFEMSCQDIAFLASHGFLDFYDEGGKSYIRPTISGWLVSNTLVFELVKNIRAL